LAGTAATAVIAITAGAASFLPAPVALLTTGISFDGGYGEYMVAPAEALALVPDRTLCRSTARR
jgi:NADPH:quinone reductase-like Zn-dependent oxidoreductase